MKLETSGQYMENRLFRNSFQALIIFLIFFPLTNLTRINQMLFQIISTVNINLFYFEL